MLCVNIYSKGSDRLLEERRYFHSWETASNYCKYVKQDRCYFVIVKR